ncbi:MAG: hypothetical protein DRI61_15560 [Chloroflexi bacterium]|nr:MAG: hypothetical protein DRI61_15560 [Chloroflexota bacterium]
MRQKKMIVQVILLRVLLNDLMVRYCLLLDIILVYVLKIFKFLLVQQLIMHILKGLHGIQI